MIERCASVEQPGWLTLREALWPHCSDSALMIYDRRRFLDLSEQVFFAKPAKPELIAQFRERNRVKKEALKQVEPVNLQGRNLGRVNLIQAFLPGADLREANLQGAWSAVVILRAIRAVGR